MFATSHLVNLATIYLYCHLKTGKTVIITTFFYKFIILFTRIVIKCTDRVTYIYLTLN